VRWIRVFEVMFGADFVLLGLLAGSFLIVNVNAGGIMLPLETTSVLSGNGATRRGAKGIGGSGPNSLVGIAS